MVVVIAAAHLLVLLDQHVLGDPNVGVGVQVFVDPVDGAAVGQLQMLPADVIRKELVILLLSYVWLRRAVEQVSERQQRLRSRIGPRRPVPCALVARSEAKTRATSFGCRRPVFARETLRIE